MFTTDTVIQQIVINCHPTSVQNRYPALLFNNSLDAHIWSERARYLLSVHSRYINNSLHLGRKYARIFHLSADIMCSETRTVFRERSSRRTVSFEEQMMSKDKYLSIFLPQMEAIVFIILQIFLNKGAQFRRPFLKTI